MTNVEYCSYFVPMIIGFAGLFVTGMICILGIMIDAIMQKLKKA